MLQPLQPTASLPLLSPNSVGDAPKLFEIAAGHIVDAAARSVPLVHVNAASVGTAHDGELSCV